MQNPPSGTQSYTNNSGALSYLNFINSEDGQIFQQVQGQAIIARLPSGKKLSILDAGCGPGWLATRLQQLGHQVKACDASPQLLDYAKDHYPSIDCELCDITQPLPYADEEFDAVILSMAALDLNNQQAAFKNLKKILKPGGLLIATIVNPYYGFPVGVWKRGILGFLLKKFPQLKLRPYGNFLRNQDRSFNWGNNSLVSYFYTLPEQLNALLQSGFSLNYLADILIDADSKKYNLQYRLFRFPIYLLLELTKK